MKVRKLRHWLHRKGIARLLNCCRNNVNRSATAYVEVRGPERMAVALARGVVKHDDLTCPDWRTIRVTKVKQVGPMHYKIILSYQRA